MGRVYIANTECVIITTTTTTVVTTTTTLPITTTTTTQDWSLCTQCPPGYDAVAQGCIQYDEVAATYSGTTYTVVKKTSNAAYSVYGGLMFSSWNYNGTGTFERFGVSPVNTYWTNQPYNNPGTLGVMNRTSVWGSTTLSNQDIGFSVCVNIDIPKTYYIGFGCDNYGKIKLNGTMILEQDVAALKTMFGSLGMSSPYDDGVSFKYWYVYPVYLPQGQNVIEVFGHNVSSVAAVGIEIYDATPAKIMTATSDSDLTGKFIFRSQDLVGQTLYYEYSTGGGFHGYSCAEGYALSTCGGTVMCVKRDFIPCQGGTTTTTTALIATTTTTISEQSALIACINDAFITEVTLPFTPLSTGGEGEMILETNDYILMCFQDSYVNNYLYSTLYRYNKNDQTETYKRFVTVNGYYGDAHKVPEMFITSQGTLLIAVEVLPGNNNHNGAIELFRWADISDLDTYTSIVFGNASTERLAYSDFYEINGTIIIDHRRYSGTPPYRAYVKSTDDGLSVGPVTQYLDFGDSEYWNYVKPIQNNRITYPIIAHTPLWTTTGHYAFQYITFLKTDFVNFYGLDNTDFGTTLTKAEVDSTVEWGDTTKNDNNFYYGAISKVGDFIVIWGYIGTGNMNTVGVMSQIQIVKTDIHTGETTIGNAIDNPFGDLVRYGNLLNICNKLHCKIYYNDNIYYYKIADDLNSITLIYSEAGATNWNYPLWHRMSDLTGEWNKTTNKVKIYRFPNQDLIPEYNYEEVTTTTTTAAATTTTTAAVTTTTTAAVTTTTTTVIALKTGLVSVWELDETSGTNVEDAHSVNDGVNTGTATVNQVGKINNAYDFDGTNDFIDMNSMLITSFPFSISMWVKPDALDKYIFGSNSGITNFAGIMSSIHAAYINVGFGNNTGIGIGNRKTFKYTASLSVGQWYHIVITATSLNSSNVKVYVNGNILSYESQDGTASSAVFNVGETRIANGWGTTAKMDGLIDQTAIWNRELTTTEVTALYNSGNGLAYTSWLPLATTTTTTVPVTTTTTTA